MDQTESSTVGISIRPAALEDCGAVGLVTVTASLAAFIGHIPERALDLGWTPSDSAAGWHRVLGSLSDDEFFLVVESDDEVLGFVWAGLSRTGPVGEGEIKGLYVLPTRHRQGLGRLLMSEAVQRLQSWGTSSLVAGCIVENPSCEFYRHLGGVEVFRRPNTVDRYSTEEIFFRWTDLDTFA